MLNNFRIKLGEEFVIWRVGLIPGIVVIAIIIIARITGNLQFFELAFFDKFLRLRPEEPMDERVVIVGINEEDIRQMKTYPVPDKELAELINKLQIHQPRVIGLDIIRDVPVRPGHSELVNVFKNSKNLIAVEKVLPQVINPPPSLPLNQVGFADAINDADGVIRRSLLRTPTKDKGYKFSFTLRLAEEYLKRQNVTVEHIMSNRSALLLNNQEMPRIFPNSGGYISADDGGFQSLINYRNSRFRVLSLQDIKKNKFSPRWIRDRIVIIGVMSPGIDTKTVPGMQFSQAGLGLVYGVEIQAHAVSQIVSNVLDKRPTIDTWADGWEYVWIVGWGLLAIVFARLTQSPFKNYLVVGIGSLSLVFISYYLLTLGWWIPLVPTILVFAINGVGLTALYQYDQVLKTKIQERQRIIEHSYDMIHNGPLQDLNKILRRLGDIETSQQTIFIDMENLNQEIRGVYEYLRQEAVSDNYNYYIINQEAINLQDPVHSVLSQVYTYTLERDLPCFQTLKIAIPNFESIDNQKFSIAQKRLLCQFLEESLCNVGKHAHGITRLRVNFIKEQDKYILNIIDNGSATNSNREGWGTEQFKNIARQLKGKFQRFPNKDNKGTVCQLSVAMTKDWLAIINRLIGM